MPDDTRHSGVFFCFFLFFKDTLVWVTGLLVQPFKCGTVGNFCFYFGSFNGDVFLKGMSLKKKKTEGTQYFSESAEKYFPEQCNISVNQHKSISGEGEEGGRKGNSFFFF